MLVAGDREIVVGGFTNVGWVAWFNAHCVCRSVRDPVALELSQALSARSEHWLRLLRDEDARDRERDPWSCLWGSTARVCDRHLANAPMGTADSLHLRGVRNSK